MASSVSSEQAFLQGGITITKHCNRLKGDIVEALQCLKYAIQHDLLFKEPGPSSATEDFEIDDQSEGTDKLCLDLFDDEEGPGWGD
jgi:hAT family C-terminal dimerisation region